VLIFLTAALAGSPSASDALILTPPHGFVLHNTSAVYDPTTESVPVFAGVAMQPGYRAHVNGHLQGGNPGPRGLLIRNDVALGPNAPWWYSGAPSWPSWIDAHRYVEPTRLLLPVMVESFDPTTGGTLGRTRHLVVDGRAGDTLHWTTDLTPQPSALELQLTPTGLEAFERAHDAMMVFPDLDTYNDRLDALAASVLPTESGFTACFPITDEPAFLTLPSYAAVFALALAQKEAYDLGIDAADSALLAGRLVEAAVLRAAAEALCVQDDPTASGFEVCVTRMETDPTGMVAGDFGNATLEPSVTIGDLASAYTFEDLDATFHIELRDLSIRWTEGHALCEPNPEVAIDDARFADTPWLATWGECTDQHLLAASSGLLQPNTFDLSPDPADPEHLWVRQLSESQTFLAATTTEITQTCSQDFIEGLVQGELLDQAWFLGGLVGMAWDDGLPFTDQAQALEHLFSGFDVGRLPAPYSVDETPYASVDTRFDRGLVLQYDSASAPPTGTHTHGNMVRWMRDAPRPLDLFDNGRTPQGDLPFDLSLHVTQDLINQHLHAAAAEPVLAADLEPTWNDLGVTPPAGVDGDTPMPLTGANLGQWALPLFALGPNLRLDVVQTMPPFVSIPPDLAGVPNAAAMPVLLSWGQVEVRLLQPQASGPDRVVFAVAFDVFDEDLDLDVHTGPVDGSILRVRKGEMSHDARVIVNDLVLCPSAVDANLPTFLGACEAQMRIVLEDTFGPMLEDRLVDALRGIPMPRWFDAQGLTPDPVEIAGEVERVSIAGAVTFFLDLD
jgi:hypothetical protein